MIQVVTDNSCDLPAELVERHGVTTVPVSVFIDGTSFRQGSDITTQEYYEKMARSGELPRTAQPPPGAFAEAFTEASARGPVLCLTLSSRLSGTYQSACVGRDLSGVDVAVFDTLTASVGHGLQVLRAAQLAESGCTIEEALDGLTAYRSEMNTVVLLRTLENLVRGGRLNKMQGNLSRLLDIRVLLHDVDGEVGLLEKVHGHRKLIERALRFICGKRPDLSDRDVGIAHFNNPTDVEVLRRELTERCRPRNFVVGEMGPALATYAGEGGIIVAF